MQSCSGVFGRNVCPSELTVHPSCLAHCPSPHTPLHASSTIKHHIHKRRGRIPAPLSPAPAWQREATWSSLDRGDPWGLCIRHDGHSLIGGVAVYSCTILEDQCVCGWVCGLHLAVTWMFISLLILSPFFVFCVSLLTELLSVTSCCSLSCLISFYSLEEHLQ